MQSSQVKRHIHTCMKRSSWLYDEEAALKHIPVGLRREILSALRVGLNPKHSTLNTKLAADIERIAGRSCNWRRQCKSPMLLLQAGRGDAVKSIENMSPSWAKSHWSLGFGV
jgi:hypothetical protein